MQFIFIESSRLISFQKDRSKKAWVEARWSSKANTSSLSLTWSHHVISWSLGVIICCSGAFADFAPFSRRAQGWVIIECDHLLNDRVVLASELSRVRILIWIIPTLIDDPFFFTWLHVALEWAIIVADHTTERIEEAITDVVGSSGYKPWALNVVNDESLSIGTDSFKHLSVEATITLRGVRPFLILKRQIVVEEVVSRD